MRKEKFRVDGMTCAACSARVENVARGVEGVNKAEVNLLAGKLFIDVNSQAVADSVIAAVNNAGYSASLNNTEKKDVTNQTQNQLHEMKKPIIGSSVFLAL